MIWSDKEAWRIDNRVTWLGLRDGDLVSGKIVESGIAPASLTLHEGEKFEFSAPSNN